MKVTASIERQANRLLALLQRPGVTSKIDDTVIVVVAPTSSRRQPPERFPKACVTRLLEDGAIERSGNGFRLSEAGQKRLLRHAHRSNPTSAPAGEEAIDAFRAQHDEITRRKTGDGSRTAQFNETESPLLWMKRRKDAQGVAMLSDAAFAAGERLREDFTLSQIAPRLTADWSNPMAGGRTYSPSAMNASDSMLAARQRLDQALDTAGPEFSGLLLDLCCFLKGLAQIEHERNWPARSAKIVVRLALERLARHYGFSSEARGPSGASIRR